MKNRIAILLCLTMALSLFSCSVNDRENEESAGINNVSSTSNDQKNEETHASNDPFSPLNAAAMQMYEAAIREEICVIDERLGESSLKSLRFSSEGARLEECNLLQKAILDVDRDGVNEYVIKSPDQAYIILKYDNGKVYGYHLEGCDYYRFNTDGTFYWCNSPKTAARECGLSEIVLEGGALNVKSLYRLKDFPTSEYYVGGKPVTGNEYDSYSWQTIYKKKSAFFSQFELACPYPITAEQAWNLANAYWDHQNGCKEQSAGTIWTAAIVLLDTPHAETDDYRFAFHVEWNSGGALEGYECMPPSTVQEKDQILVNAYTGEITTPAGKSGSQAISIEEAIEIVKKYEHIDSDEEERGYRVSLDANEPAPDHFYVITVHKIVGQNAVFQARRWVDKYTGEIVFEYYIYGK